MGLIQPLVWNERNGNLVGGHQRLKIMDSIQKGDYEITVAAVNLTDKQEKEANILLNNSNLMGEWDNERLSEMFQEIDFEDVMFSADDLNILGVEVESKNMDAAPASVDAVVDEMEKIKKIKDARKRFSEEQQEEGRVDYTLTIVFKTPAEKEAWLRFKGIDVNTKYITLSTIEGKGSREPFESEKEAKKTKKDKK